MDEDELSEENDEDDSEMYEVEKILKHKKSKGGTHLLIKWKGYAETTWEPEELMRESIEDDVNKYFLQIMTSEKGAHKICEYPDCIYQTLKPDNCNIRGCNNKLHHMCQQDHDVKYWKGGLEDKVGMIKVCYTCAKNRIE